MNLIENNKIRKQLILSLGISLLFFIVKGIKYAVIESYIPLLFVVVIITALFLCYKVSLKAFRRMLRFWACIIIIWSVIRLIFCIYLEFDTKLTESHLREQFGLWHNLMSIIMLVIGITLIRQLKITKAIA